MKNSPSDNLIGLMADQHPGLLAGMLAILKSGNAFVPIDPDYPEERINFILEDCRIDILITEERHLAKALALAERSPFLKHVICLDRIAEDAVSGEAVAVYDLDDYAAEPPSPTPVEVTPDHLAYVIYTSGSTGAPKGVPITHRNLSPLLDWSERCFNFGEHTNVLQNLNPCFDFGVFELLTTLLFGGTLHFLGRDRLHNIAAYVDYLNEQEINTFHTTPSFFRSLLPFIERLERLEILHLGGEALTENMVADIFDKVGDRCVLYNGYGPTEATVNCSIYEIGRRTDRRNGGTANIPIGKASANNVIYLLDRHLEPAPIGQPGELHVGGVALAYGYLNRPGLTAERFIPDPFSDRPGARLYRTGDLARYLPDGNIEYLGRIDHQVKVRGFRIELGEIEAVLGEHPGVREAVVLARSAGEDSGPQRLVAYLVPNGKSASAGELRRYLQQKLPEYMVPAVFMWLEALPLTPNGKVDRRALPAPDQGRPELATTYVAPRTPAEETLARIWGQVLGLEQVGVHDNFFELGGDSMRIIQVVAWANQAGLELTPAQLFQFPTVEGVARVAGTAGGVTAEQGLVTGPVQLTPIQRWFLEREDAEPHHWNWAFLREVPQGLDPALLAGTVEQLLRHHDALRLRFHRTETGWQAENAGAGDPPPFSLIDLSAVAPEDLRPAIETAAAGLQGSLDLSAGPLLRVAYFRLPPGGADRVLIIFHHLVVDVVSTRILMEDMQTIMQQLGQGRPVQLPAKTTSFREWSRRLSEYAQSPALRQELDYWVETLSHEAAPLPLDHPGGVNSEASAAVVIESFPADGTRALLQDLPAAYGVQINEVLLAALAQAFASWAGQPSLLVEMEGHGREYVLDGVDVSRTVGWFTSVYPVRLDLGQTTDAAAALQAVKAQLRRVPKRGIGYGLLRYLAEDEAVRQRLQALPRAEVNFNYLGQLDQQVSEATPFRTARENRGPERSLNGRRNFLLYVVGSIRGGVLRMHWNYSRNIHERATIERLAKNYNEALRSLVALLRPLERADE